MNQTAVSAMPSSAAPSCLGGVLVHVPVEHGLQLGVVALGEAEEHADDADRELVGVVAHEVEARFAGDGLRDLAEQVSDLGLDAAHRSRREEPGDERAVDRVPGRILEDEEAGGHVDAGNHDVVDPALARDELVALTQHTRDVVEPAHRVELVRLVVIERRLVPQAAVHRVGRGVDLAVVHVEVDVRRRHRHFHSPSLPDIPATVPVPAVG